MKLLLLGLCLLLAQTSSAYTSFHWFGDPTVGMSDAQRRAYYARQEAAARRAREAAAAAEARKQAKIDAFARHLHGLGIDLKPVFEAAGSRGGLGVCNNGSLCHFSRRGEIAAVVVEAGTLNLAASDFRAVSSAAGDFLIYLPNRGNAQSREQLEAAGALMSTEQFGIAAARAVILRENEALRRLN